MLSLVKYPDPILTTPCLPVEEITKEIQDLAIEMFALMRSQSGIGLAANQVNRNLRLFVVDIWWPNTAETESGLVFINPKLTLSKKTQRREEGCLSFPGVAEFVRRAESLTVEALNIAGESFTLEASGLLAVCIQHEYDHIEGKTFLERMGTVERMFAKKTLKK